MLCLIRIDIVKLTLAQGCEALCGSKLLSPIGVNIAQLKFRLNRTPIVSELLSLILGAAVELNLDQQNKSIAHKTNTQHRLLGCRGLMAIWAVADGFFLIMLCSGLWALASLLWSLVSGLWSSGPWKLSSGLWPLASGLWRFGSMFSVRPRFVFALVCSYVVFFAPACCTLIAR